jgi:hypothetical protein
MALVGAGLTAGLGHASRMAAMATQRAPTPAPYFSLADGAWMPYACTWDAETGAFRGVEGPRGFASYREAMEASRFLALIVTA